MKRFKLGMWLFVGSLIAGLLLVGFILVSRPWVYTYGYGNPPWFDYMMVVSGPLFVSLIILGAWLMYGGDRETL